MERRFTKKSNVKIEKRADGQQVIVGYAAVFYDPGNPGTEYELWPAGGGHARAVERIMPGAFDRAIREDDVRGLFNHEPNLVLGRTGGTMNLSADSKGLRYEIIPPDNTIGRDLIVSIQRGDISGSSFSFIADVVNWRTTPDDEIREIQSVNPLFDVGPVTYPAYEATTTGLRDSAEVDEARACRARWAKRQADIVAVIARAKARAYEVDEINL